MDIKEIKKDLVEYDLYYLLDAVEYGEYLVTIINEGNKIVIAVYDEWGSAAHVMDRKDFLNIGTTDELENYINSIIYYNYIAHEGE